MRFSVIAAQAIALGLVAAAPAVDKRGNCDKSTSSASKTTSSSSSSVTAKVSATNVAAAAVASASSSTSSAAPVAAASSSSSSSPAAAASTSSSAVTAASVAASTTAAPTTAAAVAATSTSSSSTAYVSPTVVPSVGSYTYQLCAVEPTVNGVSTRLLTGQQEQGQAAMTVESCASWCSGYTYFGLEYGQECYCGNSITTGTTVDTTGGCSIVCDGNSGEYCGGSWRMQLYALGSAGSVSLPSTYSASAAVATATATASGSGSGSATTTAAASVATASGASSLSGWESVGCVIEPFDNGGSGRGLTGQSTSGSGMTLEACATFCTGWDYFGVEYADECYCGDSLAANSAWDLLNCADPCAGNSAETCGGSGHFNLYQLSNMTTVTLPTYSVATTTASSSTSTAAVVAAASTAVSTVVPAVTTVVSNVAAAAATTVAASSSSTSTLAAATSTSSATFVASAVVVPVSTKTSTATTMSTVVAAASSTATTCAAPISTSVSTLSSTFLGIKYTYSHYFAGSACTLANSNPGNILPSLLPPITLAISGSNALSAAAQTCIAKAGILSAVYKSFDLHYRTDTCAWECVMYPGTNTVTSYFNVPNTAVSQTHGFSC